MRGCVYRKPYPGLLSEESAKYAMREPAVSIEQYRIRIDPARVGSREVMLAIHVSDRIDLRGPMTRAPPATTDVAPEGTRFIAGFRNAGGAGPTSYSSQASLGKSRFPWWSGFTVAPNRRTTSRPAPE
jgi:hypothetical protein